MSDARNSSGPEVSLTDVDVHRPEPAGRGTPTLVVQFGYSTTASHRNHDHQRRRLLPRFQPLLRRVCQSGTFVSDRVVASSVASVTAVCSPTADCTGSPTSITVTVTETADSNGAPYQYSLTATFRKLIGAGAPCIRKGS